MRRAAISAGTIERSRARAFAPEHATAQLVAIDLRWWHVLVIVLALVIGLAGDVHVELPGHALIGVAMWATMLAFLGRIPAPERYTLVACLAIATAGELVLSLVWGLYTYRLGNIPPFVPPGHVLLFMLGLWLAERMTDKTARCLFACAGLYAVAAALVGFDTFAGLLFLVIAVAWLALPQHRRLYASTFTWSIALEIYGTWLGVWSWAAQVPGLPLVTTNPPGTVGAFYCALDALVVTAMLLLVSPAKRSYAARAV